MKVVQKKEIASLWSGYGNVSRLTMSDNSTVIRKQVSAPTTSFNEIDESHKRKMLSYEVERYFYTHVASQVENAHIAELHESESNFMVMEDLSVKFPYQDISGCSENDEKLVLEWLANFHASLWQPTYPTVPPPLAATNETGLWEEGSYWYLRTRQDEFESMPSNDKYRQIGPIVDAMIRAIPSEFLTLIHGDAKSANIAYSKDKSTGAYNAVAMYDFQYVGTSPGVRDVVYYLVSSSRHANTKESEYLHFYHDTLLAALQKSIDSSVLAAAQHYTYEVMLDHFELCMLDYYRFMRGWGMWGNHRYAAKRCEEILMKRKDLL